ncbi:MAG TPA: hypothetical protein VJ573_00300 [Actinomycetota bacterium]|nr:hypothetical protein [Actinomycetota bacterium]
MLTTDLLFGMGTAALVGLGVLLFLIWVWFAIPIVRRVRDEEDGR